MSDDLEHRLKTVETKVNDLDKAVAVSDTKLDHVQCDTAAIRSDIKKLVWIILGALVAAAMGFIVKGGLFIG